MQRYRVNYVLLFGLVIGALVSGGAVYGLWRFQIDRNAGNLIVRAEKAEAENNYRTAATLYNQYLSIRPNDEEIMAKHAVAWDRLAVSDEVRREELMLAYKIMDDTVRVLPENDELRRTAIDLCMSDRFRTYVPALQHINILLTRHPEDAELKVLKARCHMRIGDDEAVPYSYRLIGYDIATGEFDAAKAESPHEPIVYRNLADYFVLKDDRPQLAERVMEQLVRANPDSYEAYLHRGQFYLSRRQPTKAEPDVRRAYELNPEDASVLLTYGSLEAELKEFEEAERYLTAGNERYPEDARFYQHLANVALQQRSYEEAMSFVDKGLQSVGPADGPLLLAYKADLQLRSQDVEGTRETIEAMKQVQFRQDYIQWLEARILLLRENWYEAGQLLQEIRTQMASYPDLQTQVDVQLGLCFEKLGQMERALESYKFALQMEPENDPARLGVQRVTTRLGLSDSGQSQSSWQALLSEEMKKPIEEQDWTRISAIMDEVADSMKLSEPGRMLLRAELMMMRKNYTEARNLLVRAYEQSPNDVSIQRAAVRLLRMDPEQGPVKALRFLEDRVISRSGDSPDLRAEKADLLIAINDSELPQQLAELTDGIDDWSIDDKVRLWYSMASRYFQLGMRDEAQRCWSVVTDLSPNDLPTRVMLFTIGHDSHDDGAMKAAQDKILEVVKTKNDSTWQFTEARRLMSLYRRGQVGQEVLSQVEELVRRASQQRPDWHELHVLRAELAMLHGNVELALEHYGKANQLGRPHAGAIVQYVRLLVDRGRFDRAKVVVEQIPAEVTRQRLLGRLYAEILYNSGAIEDSLKSAQLVIEQNPDSAPNQLWYGQMLARAADSPGLSDEARDEVKVKAGEAFQKAVELGPDVPEAWMALVGYHAFNRDRVKAEDAMRQAQLALSDERLPLVLAKCFEIMGRSFDAENLYRAAHETEPEDASITRRLAEFYLGSGNRYSSGEKIARATPLINEILRAGSEGKLGPKDVNLAWARRVAAKLLADSGDYQSLRKAEKLLASNSQDGILPVQDRLQMAQILAPRPEPISRKKAISLLEEVKAVDPRLNLPAELILGQLYFALGDWPRARKQMREVISRFPESAHARDSYIRMLLRRNRAREAADEVKKLAEIAPNSLTTLELIALVSAKTNQQQQARQALVRSLPRDLKNVTDEQLPRVEKVADLLANDLGDVDAALKLYQFIVSRNASRVFKFAEVLGRHRDVQQSIKLLEQVYQAQTATAVIQVALDVLRERRDDAGELYDAQVQTWLDRALRDSPDSIPLLMQQAELYDLQQNYEEAADLYRKLLTRRELQGKLRAVVLNNLSYLVALTGSGNSASEAMNLVLQAVEILGPTADILDTRAVILISREQFDDAVADLELSLTDNPTASKYFHKVVAHLGAGQNSDALEAWKKAIDMGLSRESISRLELEHFDKAKSQIEQLQTLSSDYEIGKPLSRRMTDVSSPVALAR